MVSCQKVAIELTKSGQFGPLFMAARALVASSSSESSLTPCFDLSDELFIFDSLSLAASQSTSVSFVKIRFVDI